MDKKGKSLWYKSKSWACMLADQVCWELVSLSFADEPSGTRSIKPAEKKKNTASSTLITGGQMIDDCECGESGKTKVI